MNSQCGEMKWIKIQINKKILYIQDMIIMEIWEILERDGIIIRRDVELKRLLFLLELKHLICFFFAGKRRKMMKIDYYLVMQLKMHLEVQVQRNPRISHRIKINRIFNNKEDNKMYHKVINKHLVVLDLLEQMLK